MESSIHFKPQCTPFPPQPKPTTLCFRSLRIALPTQIPVLPLRVTSARRVGCRTWASTTFDNETCNYLYNSDIVDSSCSVPVCLPAVRIVAETAPAVPFLIGKAQGRKDWIDATIICSCRVAILPPVGIDGNAGDERYYEIALVL